MAMQMGKPRKELTKTQKQLMKEHKQHHTAAHMKMMKELMLAGNCFQEAHRKAMKKVGR
jgi:hypothetical protein